MKWKILSAKEPKNKEEILAIILKNRSLKTKKEIDNFLNPPEPALIKPEELGIKKTALNKAIDRIKEALKNRQPIIVYGDYDADGVCATAILWEVLYKLGANVLPYIPSRIEEGYGLSEKGIENIIKHSIDNLKQKNLLIITVDHGIVANQQVEDAKKRGIEIIITDHHVPPKILPKAYSIIHTTELSGSGVAWILAREIVKNFIPPSRSRSAPLGRCPNACLPARQGLLPGEININNYLDLTAIGSIADLIPLTGANRSLVKHGLKQLNRTKRVGLLSLIKEAGLYLGNLGNYEVGYIIAPRLNAMGRLEHALDSLRLLCTPNQKRAHELAQKLGLTNRERQELTLETTKHAKNIHKSKITNQERKLIFITHESYNQGVIGLVAGKLVDQFYRPTIVVAKGEKISKASARSVNGLNIIEAIRKCSNLLIDCGGHPMAAGFTIENKNLEKFEEELEKLINKLLPEEKLEKELKIDCKIKSNHLSLSLYEEIQKMQPFGLANPEPIFLIKNLRITDIRLVGRDQKHLKLHLDDPHTKKEETITGSLSAGYVSSAISYDGIGFNLANLITNLKTGDYLDVSFNLILNEWNNNKNLQLKIKDIRRINNQKDN